MEDHFRLLQRVKDHTLIKKIYLSFQNGGHHLLPTADSPAISACTTSTNLSGLDFQSTSTIHKFKATNLEENLRRVIPELEPFCLETKVDMVRKVSSGESLCALNQEKRQILNQVSLLPITLAAN